MTLGTTGAPPRSVAASWRIAAISPELGSEDDAAQESQEFRGPLAGEEATVELGTRLLGDDVGLGAPVEDGGGHGVPDEGVLARVAGELGQEGRILERFAQVGELAPQRLALEVRQGGEILLHRPHQ